MEIKKIFAMLVMTLFMVSMVPVNFAEAFTLDPRVMTYVKENSEKLETLGLNGCMVQMIDKFSHLSKKAANAYCNEVGKHRTGIQLPKAITKIRPIKAENKIRALNIAEPEKEFLLKVRPRVLRKFASLQQENIGKLAKLKPQVLENLGKLSRAEIKAIAKKPIAIKEADITVAIQEKEAIKLKAKFKRLVPRLEKVRIVQAIDEANEIIRLKKVDLMPIKKKLQELKPKVKACEGDNSAACIKLRGDIAAHSGNYLKHLIVMLEKNLGKVKDKVIASDELTEEQVNNIKTEWYSLQGMVDKLKSEIQDINTNTQRSEIQEIVRKIKAVTKEVKQFVNKVRTLLQEKKVVTVLAKLDALEERLEAILDIMEEKGLSVDRFEVLIDSFSESVSEARINYKKALVEKKDGNNEGAMKYFAISKDAFKKAHTTLKKIAKIVKEAGWHIEASPIVVEGYVVDDKDIAAFSELITNQEKLRIGHDLNGDGSIDVADVVKLANMVDFLDSYLSKDGQLDKADAEIFAQMITILGNVNLANTYFDMNEDGNVDVTDLVEFNNFVKNFDIVG